MNSLRNEKVTWQGEDFSRQTGTLDELIYLTVQIGAARYYSALGRVLAARTRSLMRAEKCKCPSVLRRFKALIELVKKRDSDKVWQWYKGEFPVFCTLVVDNKEAFTDGAIGALK